MTLADTAVAAAQVCSNQTSDMLANWKCSFDVAHPSTVQTGGGPGAGASAHLTTPAIVMACLIVALLLFLGSRRSAAAATG